MADNRNKANWQATWRAKRSAKQFVACILMPIALVATSSAWATPASLCDAKGYTVGFFNGVWNTNTQDGALGSLHALKAVAGTTHHSEPVDYELFYNHTGSTVGATSAQDIAEVFIQRAAEFDQSGELGQRFEYLWEAVSEGHPSFFEKLAKAHAADARFFEALQTYVMTHAMAGAASAVSHPPTAADHAEHRARLDTLAAEGQKLLLIGHSQGNLFLNAAFDHVKPKIGASSVAVVHIAPASILLNGPYVLADIDVVINGLRIQGQGSVPPSNISLPLSAQDLSGHTLLGTYLDPMRSARASIEHLMTTALDGLETPSAPSHGAQRGFFTVTLTWDGAGDVDLHTFEPGGTQVFYSRKTGSAGNLDMDNVTAFGPEHYYATCDASRLVTGTYRIGINNYVGATGRTATVQVSFAQGGQPLTRTLNVGPVRGAAGNPTPMHVMNVVVSRDDAGQFTAVAN